ncbi:MAG: GrpB family protein [Acidimicrobiales bacterium]
MEPLVVVDADPVWPQRFQEITNYLSPFLADAVLRIEHVGSTAVPGLAAKPIIDVDVVVAEVSQVQGALERIESAGYQWVGDLTVTGREAFEPIRTPPLPIHHLYLVVENNRAHSDHWLLRDALSDNPELLERYAALKRENAVLAGGDAERYTALKAAFVAEVLTEARQRRGMPAVDYWEPDLD